MEILIGREVLHSVNSFVICMQADYYVVVVNSRLSLWRQALEVGLQIARVLKRRLVI